MHSPRRGVLQTAASQGANVLTLLEVGHMKSVGTLGRYLNPTSHMPRAEAWQLRDGKRRGERVDYRSVERGRHRRDSYAGAHEGWLWVPRWPGPVPGGC